MGLVRAFVFRKPDIAIDPEYAGIGSKARDFGVEPGNTRDQLANEPRKIRLRRFELLFAGLEPIAIVIIFQPFQERESFFG
jgi:hypothetical protein